MVFRRERDGDEYEEYKDRDYAAYLREEVDRCQVAVCVVGPSPCYLADDMKYDPLCDIADDESHTEHYLGIEDCDQGLIVFKPQQPVDDLHDPACDYVCGAGCLAGEIGRIDRSVDRNGKQGGWTC